MSYYEDDTVQLLHGDALDIARTLPAGSVQTIVTSPPYFGLRDYGHDGQMGAEDSVERYVTRMVILFAELRRVLADDGTLWLNLGDTYSGRADAAAAATFRRDRAAVMTGRINTAEGIGTKQLLGVPWRVALALQADGWILRSDIIWSKPSGMPESVTDRPSKSHEYLFLLAKSPRYLYDADAIAEPAAATTLARYARGKDTGYETPGQTAQTIAQPREQRPQLRRALELAEQHNLTPEHFAAIRSVGMSDAGKAKSVQSGTGKNTPEVQRLADEAKLALGGYYREFLSNGKVNKRTVWTVATVPFSEAHFAVYPPELIRPCILAGSRPGDTVLDPFSGSGTTGMVATQEGRKYVGIDLNRDYLDLSLRTRFAQPTLNYGALA